MSEKIMTVNLGGADRTLDVGKFWFTKFYGEAKNGDPLAPSKDSDFDTVVNIVMAGMQCAAKTAGADFSTTRAEVEMWCGNAEGEVIKKFLDEYTALAKGPETPGE